jgi:hypothetical protein
LVELRRSHILSKQSRGRPSSACVVLQTVPKARCGRVTRPLGTCPHSAIHRFCPSIRSTTSSARAPSKVSAVRSDSPTTLAHCRPVEARLQEILRYNMDRYASQALDTLHISRRVRELLSVHNIGQRLFAKYILGLSQGTVSELLSKPKPWDKLTEKGRDSYRKMHAWACDDNAIMMLKGLIPKKGRRPIRRCGGLFRNSR